MKKTVTQSIKLNNTEVCEILKEIFSKKLGVDVSQMKNHISVSPGYSGDFHEPSSPSSFTVTLEYAKEVEI